MHKEGKILYIEQKDIENVNIHATAVAFHCVQSDTEGKVPFQTHIPGTVKIYKSADNKKYVAMFGVIPQKVNGTLQSKEDTLPIFVECLRKIATIKNLKSILFTENLIIDESYADALHSFSQSTKAKVYVYGEPRTIIHRSFGDLLGQIDLWKQKKDPWAGFFQDRIVDKTIATLNAFLQKEAEEYFVYPPPEKIFNAMILTNLANIKAIIIGQDPYHTAGAAMGLAFSHTNEYKKIQPSLANIYTELEACGYRVNRNSGDLTKWAKQGVFLINTALTVRQSQANSHSEQWKPFIKHLFEFLNSKLKHVVVIMWGGPAQSYSKYFDSKKHKKIVSSHPCPMSARISFFGSQPFVKCNEYLREWGMKEIDWNLG